MRLRSLSIGLLATCCVTWTAVVAMAQSVEPDEGQERTSGVAPEEPAEVGEQEPEPEPRGSSRRAMNNGVLAGYSAVALGISPLGVSLLNEDVDYAEGALIMAASSLGVGSMVLGGALVGSGIALGLVGYALVEIGTEIPVLGILIIPLGVGLMVVGVASGVVGAALILGAPVSLGFAMTEADDMIGRGGENSVGITCAATGGVLVGTVGGLLLISDMEADPWLQIVAVIASGMLGGTLAYGIFRDADAAQSSEPVMVVSPFIAF